MLDTLRFNAAGEGYRAAKIKSVIRVRELVSELREVPPEDQTKRNKLWSELRGEVSYLLLDGFSEHWEQDLFNGTITPSKDSLTAFFDKISSHRSRGYTSGPLLDKPTAFILQALKERGCWKNGSLESDGSLADGAGCPHEKKSEPLRTADVRRQHELHPLCRAFY